jgi:hypothetical protein
MEIDSTFRKRFETNLLQNKCDFKDSCCSFLETNFDTYCRVAFDNLSPIAKDIKQAKNCIRKTFENNNLPTLKLRKLGYNSSWENEVSFLISNENELVFNSPEELNHRILRRDLEYKCESEFWKNEFSNSNFNDLGKFDCFDDMVVPSEKINKFNEGKFKYNTQSWLKYIFELTQYSFPEFVFSEKFSTKSVYRFLKPLETGFYFGFEYNSVTVKKEFDSGQVCLPYYFNLIVLKNDFDKDTQYDKYVLEYNHSILSLGVLGNPFFYEPCFPLTSFFSLEMYFDKLKPNQFVGKYKAEIRELSDNLIQIIHPPELGEKLKKHAFFYLHLLGITSDNYLKYLEKSLINTITNSMM